MEVLNPLGIFPKELWEIILDEVEHSKDVQSLLRGFPLLDISINSGRKRFWYLDQVLSFVCEWVHPKDLLNLRLVCKKWLAKVDFFLQNQPLSRAYSHKDKDNLNFWNYIYNDCLQIIDMRHGISKYLRNSFTEEVLKHPQHRNPFVFRQLKFFFEDGRANGRLEAFLLRMYTLLRHCGGHIWFLNLHFEDMRESVNVSLEITVEMLKLVPNLKSLCIVGRDSYSIDSAEVKKLEGNLPELRFLETIEICDWLVTVNDPFWSLLFKKYGSQVRRLELKLQECNPCGHFFPALTELELRGCYRSPEAITETLKSFVSENIVKVVLSFGGESLIQISVEQNILKWLKLFPKIKYFGINTSDNVGKADLQEEGTSDPEKDCIPSLQNFEVFDGPGLSYNFLRCFPSLRNLVIQRREEFVDFSTPDSSVKLKEQIQTGKIYESSVWECLRKLKTVKMLCDFDVESDCEFYRETYEKIKNAKKSRME